MTDKTSERPYKPMKLADMKIAIDKAVDYAASTDPNVEFWLGEEMLEMERIGQFGVVPDVVITLKQNEHVAQAAEITALKAEVERLDDENHATRCYLEGCGVNVDIHGDFVLMDVDIQYRTVQSWRRYCTSGEKVDGKLRKDFEDYSRGFTDGLVAGRVERQAEVAERDEMLAASVNIRLWLDEHYDSIDFVGSRGFTGGDDYYPTAIEAYKAIKRAPEKAK